MLILIFRGGASGPAPPPVPPDLGQVLSGEAQVRSQVVAQGRREQVIPSQVRRQVVGPRSA